MRQAEGRGTRTYGSLQRGSRSATRQMERDMARSTANINRSLAGTTAAVGTLNTALRTLALPTLTFAGGMGLIRGIRNAVSSVSDLGKQARAASMDVEELQGLMFGLSQATGVSDDQIAGAFERFSRRIGEAANGMGPLQRALERYGISVRGVNGDIRDQGDLLREVADVAARLGDQERAAFLQSAFGDVGRQLAQGFERGAKGLDDFIDQAQRAGVVIRSDTGRAAEELDDKFDQLTRRVGTFLKALAVVAAESVGLLRQAVRDLELEADQVEAIFGPGFLDGLAEDAKREVAGVVAEFDHLAESARDTAREMNQAAMVLRGMGLDEQASALTDISRGLEDTAQAFERGEKSAEDMIEALTKTSDEARGVINSMDDLNRARVSGVIRGIEALTAALKAAADMARKVAREITELEEIRFPVDSGIEVQTPGPNTPRPRAAPLDIDFGVPRPSRGGGAGGAGRPAPSEFERAAQAIRDRNAALEAEAVALLAAADAGMEYERAISYALRRAQLLTAAQRDGLTITPELTAQIDDLARSYVEAGAADADADAANAMREAQANAEAGAAAMADLCTGIVQGGEAGRRALAQLLQQMAQVAAHRAFSALLGVGGPVGAFLGGLGGADAARARRACARGPALCGGREAARAVRPEPVGHRPAAGSAGRESAGADRACRAHRPFRDPRHRAQYVGRGDAGRLGRVQPHGDAGACRADQPRPAAEWLMSGLQERLCAALRAYLQGDRPQMPDGTGLLWEAFLDLSLARTYHAQGPNPISFIEIEAWARLTRTPLQPHHVRIIRAMDVTFMEHFAADRRAGAPEGARALPRGSSHALTPALFDALRW
ncbi:MAG: phage tail assembly chaperone [Alkalilacustris sp.]